MRTLNVSVKNGIAKYEGTNPIICNNKYKVVFDFDEEWDEYFGEEKKAIFIFGDKYSEKPFNGNECEIPILKGVTKLLLGVSLENKIASTEASIDCIFSAEDIKNQGYTKYEENDGVDGENVYSEGLDFTLSDDGTYYILTGQGTWEGGNLVIPPTYNGKPVKEIGVDAFSDNNSPDTIVVPDSVEKIGEYAFSFSPAEEITLGNGVKEIGNNAFEGSLNRVINCKFAEGAVAGAPWGSKNATINYDYVG